MRRKVGGKKKKSSWFSPRCLAKLREGCWMCWLFAVVGWCGLLSGEAVQPPAGTLGSSEGADNCSRCSWSAMWVSAQSHLGRRGLWSGLHRLLAEAEILLDWHLHFPPTDMESVNPILVTVATSTTDLLETAHNVTEGTWGKDFCH